MEIVKRYWFWITSGVTILVLLIFRLVFVGSINSELATVVSAAEKEGKRVSKYAKRSGSLPNRNWIDGAENEKKELESIRDWLNEDIALRNVPFDKFFGSSVGTLVDELPESVDYKQAYGKEVKALIDHFARYPGIETGFGIDPETGGLSVGGLQLSADLFKDGKIPKEEIPLNQKQFLLQKYIIRAVTDASVTAVELAPLKVIEELKLKPSSASSANDGSKPNPRYQEGLYEKEYRVEKIEKISIDDGLRYDVQTRYRIFKVDLVCDMQLSLVTELVNNLLSIEPVMVRVRDIQIVSALGEDGIKGAERSSAENSVMTRYKEPPVSVTLSLYCMDFLNDDEREVVEDIKAGDGGGT